MKFDNIRVYNFENAFRGMRNPKESYSLSDSKFISAGEMEDEDNLLIVAKDWADYIIKYNNMPIEKRSFIVDSCIDMLIHEGHIRKGIYVVEKVYIGPKDMKLAQQLIKAGSEHRKFMREIVVSMDITAPLFWFKEFDTYKVGTVANSTSTMHKLASTPITFDCFEMDDFENLRVYDNEPYNTDTFITDIWDDIIGYCETLRLRYNETKDKKYWKELIRILPEAWLQTRTVTLNYEVLRNIYFQRRHHKLSEWHQFCEWIESLPYAKELITYEG